MMEKHRFYQAVGELDQKYLKEFEVFEHLEGQRIKKKLNLVAVVACCLLLMGAGTGLVRHFVGGGYYEDKLLGGSHSTFHSITHTVYEERDDGLYYIFEGAELNITDYCSDTDYFFLLF